jgi:hypothetical protein
MGSPLPKDTLRSSYAIHRSAWKGFYELRLYGFSEVRLMGVLRSLRLTSAGVSLWATLELSSTKGAYGLLVH